jgi:large subunit ribosomal protein L31e
LSSEELIERIYTIPLRKAWAVPRKKRSPKAIRLIREFVKKHMKSDQIIITNKVNEKVWGRGIEKPPRRIRVRVVKDKEGIVTVYLAEE